MSDIVEDGLKTLNEAWKFGKRTVLSTPEMEVKVEEATSNEEWGPSSAQLTEIASCSFRYSELPLIMGTLYRRIQDNGKNWRHVYKSLVVMDYLLKHGSEDSIRSLRAHSLEIQQLTHFHHLEEHKDVGQAIRTKAKQVLELVHDESKLRDERDKAKKNRGKYQGFGSENAMGYRGGGGGGGGGRYEDEYDRSPYAPRREEETPSPQPYRRKPREDDYSSDSDSDSDEKRAPARRPRAPSDEADRAKKHPAPAPAPAPKQFNLFELDDPVPIQPTGFPLPPGGGSGGSGAFFPQFPTPPGGHGVAPEPVREREIFSMPITPLVPSGPMAPIPAQRPPQTPEEEWDAFQSFETPKDPKDLWSQHRSLFDLQHLNLADQKTVPVKPDESKTKPIGAMLAEKQKGKPMTYTGVPPPSAGVPGPSTFAPFGPAKPAPTPTMPSAVPVYPTPTMPYVGAPAPMVMPQGYPAGYPYGAYPATMPVVPVSPAVGGATLPYTMPAYGVGRK